MRPKYGNEYEFYIYFPHAASFIRNSFCVCVCVFLCTWRLKGCFYAAYYFISSSYAQFFIEHKHSMPKKKKNLLRKMRNIFPKQKNSTRTCPHCPFNGVHAADNSHKYIQTKNYRFTRWNLLSNNYSLLVNLKPFYCFGLIRIKNSFDTKRIQLTVLPQKKTQFFYKQTDNRKKGLTSWNAK